MTWNPAFPQTDRVKHTLCATKSSWVYLVFGKAAQKRERNESTEQLHGPETCETLSLAPECTIFYPPLTSRSPPATPAITAAQYRPDVPDEEVQKDPIQPHPHPTSPEIPRSIWSSCFSQWGCQSPSARLLMTETWQQTDCCH